MGKQAVAGLRRQIISQANEPAVGTPKGGEEQKRSVCLKELQVTLADNDFDLVCVCVSSKLII